jgi:hypothetical protein
VASRGLSSVDRQLWLGASFVSCRDSRIGGVWVFSAGEFAANVTSSIVPVQGRGKEDIESRRGG